MLSPPAGVAGDAEVQIDFVGNLSNAATVISRLHRGEKRLVFCDSRSQVESLAVELRARSVRTFVSHSSLSVDARRQAEAAFAVGDDCVIVATSTLELGIDVGDLDRVIQIDAPHTVAGFLQRLGRTGRRAGTCRNCLFLATTDAALLRAVALTRLWRQGFVEPIGPPAVPYHVLAQQLLALSLQEGGVGIETWPDWVPGLIKGSGIAEEDLSALVQYMLKTDVLFVVDGLLALGQTGEARYGLKNFLELFSVFSSPPLFTVLHGRVEIGQVHRLSFQVQGRQPMTLALGGHQWAVKHIDWDRRQAYVEPTELRGRSRWLGSGQPMHFALCQSIKGVLLEEEPAPGLSKRATGRLQELRADYLWLKAGQTSLVHEGPATQWWTFAGALANGVLAKVLRDDGCTFTFDDFSLNLGNAREADAVVHRAQEKASQTAPEIAGEAPDGLSDRVKFIDCVPSQLRRRMVSARQVPREDVAAVATQPVCRIISR